MAARRKIGHVPLFQPVGKINRSLIIDMAVVDPFDGLGISAQHALVDSAVCLGFFTKSRGFDRMMTTLSQPCSKAWCTGIESATPPS